MRASKNRIGNSEFSILNCPKKNQIELFLYNSRNFLELLLGWVNPAWQMKHFLYSTTLRKIRGSHSVSNFEEIIFLKFFDINFQNFGASSLAEKTNCLKVIFDPRNEFSGWNYFRKHFFLCRFFFKNGSFWGLKITKIGIFSQNQFFFWNFETTYTLIFSRCCRPIID